MDHYTRFVVKHKKIIITLFVIAAVVCAFLSTMVGVDYKFADYLPDDAQSTVALDTMNKEYDQEVPNVRVMIKDVSIVQALKYKEKLEKIDGVQEVNWLDDATNIYQPLALTDKDTVNDWYKNKNALYQVTIDETNGYEVIQNMRKVIGDDNYMTGDAVTNAITPVTTAAEVQRIVMITVPIIFIILLLTTNSWFEPVLFMATIGIAIMINRGTNLMFGTISFVTNAAGSVTSSGLTTVTGFAALILMRFKIGPDMGQQKNTFLYGGSRVYQTNATQLGRDMKAIEKEYGQSSQLVLMVPKGDMEKEIKLNSELKDIDGVTSVVSYINSVGESIPKDFVPSDQISKLYSENYSRYVVTVKTEEGEDGWDTLVSKVQNTGKKYYGSKSLMAGNLASTKDLKETITQDMTRVNILSIAFVFVILMFNFKSILLPVILTLVIEASIWINLTVPYFTDETMFYIGYLIISSVQLGATIDYGILFTDRYIENRKQMGKKRAVLSFILVIFVLPGLLMVFDKLIEKLTYHADFYKGGKA